MAAPVVIATDGGKQSDAALVAGRILAGRKHTAMRVLTVVNPPPILTSERGLPYFAAPDASRRADRTRPVREQLRRVWPDERVDVAIYDGDPATRITAVAHRENASLIVVGIGRHRVVDRVFGDETALRLARMADVPVLAIARGSSDAPRCIIVAVDFSETSLRAARLAADIAARDAMLYLVHVEPRDAAADEWPTMGGAYRDDAGYALSRLGDSLRVPEGVSVQHVLLYGDPGAELLGFATRVDADLIATGSNGHGRVTRMLIGSVAAHVLRHSTCSVLIVPHEAVAMRASPLASRIADRDRGASSGKDG